jgi:hypothetical protein
MGWDKIEGKRTDQASTVRVAIHSPSGTNPYHSMRIYIGRGIVAQLKWNNGCRVDAFHGSGKDKGRMSLQLVDRGRFELKFTRKAERGSLHFSTNNLPPGVPQMARPVAVCSHVVAPDGTLEFSIPEHFYSAKPTPRTLVGRPKGGALRDVVRGDMRGDSGGALGGQVQ